MHGNRRCGEAGTHRRELISLGPLGTSTETGGSVYDSAGRRTGGSLLQTPTIAADAISPTKLTRPRIVNFALLSIVAAGILLRATQYAASTSLWFDEIALVRGILSLDLADLLTQPLPFNQVAPKAFLLAQKLAVLTFGPADYVLRLVPFLCSVAALVGFWRLTQRALPPSGSLMATLLFATAAPFVAFAGVVKQYSTDLCAAVFLSWLALDLITGPVSERKAWRAGFAGAILQAFSQPAVLMAAALVGPIMLWMSADPPHARRRRVTIVAGLWGASALAMTAWALAMMSPATRDYMHVYWADGFAPTSFARASAVRWPWPNIRLLFGSGDQASLAYPFSPLYPVLAALGFGVLWVRQRRLAVILLAPLVVTLGAAIVHQYPFRDRLILFLVPSLLMAIAAVGAAVYGFVERFSRAIAVLAVMALAIPATTPVARLPPPYRVEDVKSVLAHVQARRQSNDSVYVYYGAAPGMSVYGSAYGFSRDAYAVGGCHRGDSRRYLEELDTFRGSSRVWIVLTHALRNYREREDIVAYLDAIGTRLVAVNVASRAVGRNPLPAEGFLYDLSQPAQLENASAQSFPLTGPRAEIGRNPCAVSPQAVNLSDFECTGSPDAPCTRRPSGQERPPARTD